MTMRSPRRDRNTTAPRSVRMSLPTGTRSPIASRSKGAEPRRALAMPLMPETRHPGTEVTSAFGSMAARSSAAAGTAVATRAASRTVPKIARRKEGVIQDLTDCGGCRRRGAAGSRDVVRQGRGRVGRQLFQQGFFKKIANKVLRKHHLL